MSNTNDGGPAFPSKFTTDEHGTPVTAWVKGMSLRDWFAGQALVGMLAGRTTSLDPNVVGACAYEFADQTLAARERTTA